MCLIIDRNDSRPIPAEWADNAMHHNPDGWGVMWADSGRIHTARGMRRKGFARAISRADGHPATVHFRYGTHGSRNVANCHPFEFSDGRYAVMHNGMLDCVPSHEKGRSDTYHLARYLLGPMLDASPDLFGTDDFERCLADMIGPGNKLVILRADGEKMIVNRCQGSDVGGFWLSNTYSIADPARAKAACTSAPSTRFGMSWNDDDETDDRASGYAWSRPIRPCDEPGYTLEDVAALPFEDIVETCLNDPEFVAEAIIQHFM